MNKSTLLLLLCSGLFILNVVLMIFMYLNKPLNSNHDRRGGHIRASDVMVERLQLDPDQEAVFKEMRAAHMAQNESINHLIFIAYDELFYLLQDDNVDEERKNQIFHKIEALTSDLNTSNFEHFLKLKSILGKDQIPYFNSFTQELREKFGPQEGKFPPPRRNN